MDIESNYIHLCPEYLELELKDIIEILNKHEDLINKYLQEVATNGDPSLLEAISEVIFRLRVKYYQVYLEVNHLVDEAYYLIENREIAESEE